VILPLIALSLLLPDFTQTTPGPTLSIGQGAFVAIVAVGLYATFLALQTGRHRNYFKFEEGELLEEPEEGASMASCRMSCCWSPTWCQPSTLPSSSRCQWIT
jgi:Ca2+/H+ antiporter